MDGTGGGRSGNAYRQPRSADTVRTITELSRSLGIEVLTLYAFSDENWGRPPAEIAFLMEMLVQYLKSELPTMKKNGIRLRTIGRIEKLPRSAQEWLDRAAAETTEGSKMVLALALSYGGRGEILEAVRRLSASGVSPVNITEETFASFLDTQGLPDPDLIIRTSGEKRISNFLLWQVAYAELYFTETLWPDFDEREYLLALLDYQGRQRRFGLTGGQLVNKE
jgi:undecaprenyl diphosphate synthase